MVPSSAAEATDARRAFVWIAIVALLLALALSATWFVMANRLDVAVRLAVETAGGQGVRIACANQSVFGYPFRLGLRCDTLGVDAPEKGIAASGRALRTAAQIYRPTQVVAELDAPLAVSAAGAPPFEIDWDLAQASAHFWTEGLDRLSLVVDGPSIALGTSGALRPLVRSERFEIHARRREDSLDLAVLDRAIRPLEPALAALPAFDASGDVTIDDAGPWLSGEWPGATLGEALAGKAGTIRSLRLAFPGAETAAGAGPPASAEISGPFSIAADGTISGEFDVAVTDPARLAALVSAVLPDASGVASTVASGIAFAGRTENGRTTVRISVRAGEAALGIIPLGRIPPVE